MLKKLFLALAAVSLPVFAQTCSTPLCTVTAANLTDASGSAITAGTIYFIPNQPFRITGKGQAVSTVVKATITNGAFSTTLADTTQTTPLNVSYRAYIRDANGNVIGGSESYNLAAPFQAIQMSDGWCSTSGCNFDLYDISTQPLGVTLIGVAWGNINGTLASQADLMGALNAKEATAHKGQANGYAGLNGSSQVAVANLPVGTTSGTVAAGDDNRFLNTTKVNGVSVASLSGLLKLSSGTPSVASANDVIALWASGSCSGYLKSDLTCSTPTGGGGGATTPATASLLKGNGSANGVVAATDGTDYYSPTDDLTTNTALATALSGKQASGSYITGNQTISVSGDATGSGATAISLAVSKVNGGVIPTSAACVATNSSGQFTPTSCSSGGASTPATSSVLKGNGSANGVTAATAGTDYVVPSGSVATATNLAGGAMGALPYQADSGTTGLLAGNATTTKKFLTSIGDGTNPTTPAWGTISSAELPAGTVTGTSLTSTNVVVGNAASAIKVTGVTIDSGNNLVTAGNVTANSFVSTNGAALAISGATGSLPGTPPSTGTGYLHFSSTVGPEYEDPSGNTYQMLLESSLLCGANMVMAGPASGASTTAPTCRLLTAADTSSVLNPGGGLSIYSNSAYNSTLSGPQIWGNTSTGSLNLSSTGSGVITFNWNAGGSSNALRFGNENPTSPVSLFDLYFGSVNSGYASGEPTIRVNSGVMIFNGTGSAPLRFNYDAGTGGAVYYDGAGNTTATINGSGNATFGGTSDLATTTYKVYANGLAHATTYESAVSTVTASATPTFDLSLGDLKLTLAQNVTSSTFTNIRQGRANRLEVCQPGSGGPYTFTAPTTAANFPTITTTAGACTMVALQSFDGTSEIASGGTTGGGSSAFSALTSATNTTAAMVVGTGASLSASGSGTIAATTAAALALTLPSGIQAEYLLTEGTGLPQDSSGNGYHASAMSATWTTGGILLGAPGTVSVPAAACSAAKTIYVSYNYRLDTTSTEAFFSLFGDDANQLLGYVPVFNGAPGTVGSGNPGMVAIDKALGETSLTWVSSPQALYINGTPASGYRYTNTSTFSPTSVCKIGNNGTANSYYMPGTVVHGVYVFNRSLSATEVAQVEEYDRSRRAAMGIRPSSQNRQTNPLLFLGDSITYDYGGGYGASLKNTYPYFSAGNLGQGWPYYNFGQVGEVTGTMLTDSTSLAQPITRQYYGETPVWIVAGGTNDITTSQTAASVYSNINAICSNAHANGAKCIATTVMASTDMTSPMLTVRSTLNASILSNWLGGSSNIDWVQDWGNDPVMGYLGANTTWFTDGKHPTAAGNRIMAQRAADAIRNVTGLGNQPHTVKISVPYTALTAINSGSTSQVVNLFQLGPKQVVQRVTARITAAFVATSMTALGFTVGDSGTGGTATTYDALGTSLLATGTHDSAGIAFDSTNGIVTMTFTSTGANLNTFSAGNVDVEITTMVQP